MNGSEEKKRKKKKTKRNLMRNKKRDLMPLRTVQTLEDPPYPHVLVDQPLYNIHVHPN